MTDPGYAATRPASVCGSGNGRPSSNALSEAITYVKSTGNAFDVPWGEVQHVERKR
jgi:hypothetical protein